MHVFQHGNVQEGEARPCSKRVGGDVRDEVVGKSPSNEHVTHCDSLQSVGSTYSS